MIKFILLISIIFPNFSFAEIENLGQAEKVKFVFQNLTKDKLHLIDEFYSSDVEFVDPVGKITTSKSIKEYYKSLYQNVKTIRFDFSQIYEQGNTIIAIWSMYLETDKLNGGEGYSIDGNSVITFNPQGKVSYHRDYFDMGAFVYEKIPVLGFFVKKIKANFQHSDSK
jgi:hypothetical protein